MKSIQKCRIHAALGIAAAIIALLLLTVKSNSGESMEYRDYDIPDTSGLEYPFNTMSLDWDDSILSGWRHYDIPDEYVQRGGYFPDAVQVYAYALCVQNGVDYAVVLAIVEAGNGYQYDKESANGRIGYMQILADENDDTLSKDVLLNPYYNLYIGIHIFADCYENSGSLEGAIQVYFSGTNQSYLSEVLSIAERIRSELSELEETGGFYVKSE